MLDQPTDDKPSTSAIVSKPKHASMISDRIGEICENGPCPVEWEPMNANMVSDRIGAEWEDGPCPVEGESLRDGSNLPYQRHPDIPCGELSSDNLPAFHQRLTDNQLGHIFAASQSPTFPLQRTELCAFWPADFNEEGGIKCGRTGYGKAYDRQGWPFRYSFRYSCLKQLCGATPNTGNEEEVEVSRPSRRFLSSGRLMVDDPDYHITKAKSEVDGARFELGKRLTSLDWKLRSGQLHIEKLQDQVRQGQGDIRREQATLEKRYEALELKQQKLQREHDQLEDDLKLSQERQRLVQVESIRCGGFWAISACRALPSLIYNRFKVA